MFDSIVVALKPRFPAILLYISSTSSLLVGVVAHSVGFIVLARFLGTEQYGYLATISAVTNLVCPLCGLGTSEAMRRRVGRDPSSYPSLLGHSLIVLGVTGLLLSATVSAGLTLFVKILSDPLANFSLMLLFVSCNVVLYTWIGLVEQIFLAHSQFKRANIVNAGFGVARAVTVVVACFGFGVNHLPAWAIWNAGLYVGMSAACAGAIWSFGPPRWRLLVDELKLGTTMSGAGFLWALRQNVDILVLSSVEAPAVIGAYGVVRRIVSTASILGASFDRQIYAKLVIVGKTGPAATFRLAQKYAAYALGIAASASLGIFVLAPFLPWIFGKGFSGAIPMLRILCWSLLLGAVQNVAFDALNAADEHQARFVSGTVAGVLGASLVAALTHMYGISGTFAAAYLADAIMTLVLWVTLQRLSVSPSKKLGVP